MCDKERTESSAEQELTVANRLRFGCYSPARISEADCKVSCKANSKADSKANSTADSKVNRKADCEAA